MLKRKKGQEDNLHSGGNLPNCKTALKICYMTMIVKSQRAKKNGALHIKKKHSPRGPSMF
jgi:hypothetical protein